MFNVKSRRLSQIQNEEEIDRVLRTKKCSEDVIKYLFVSRKLHRFLANAGYNSLNIFSVVNHNMDIIDEFLVVPKDCEHLKRMTFNMEQYMKQ